MWRFRRKDDKAESAGTAVADPPVDGFSGSTEQLKAEIERLSEANRVNPDRETERRLLRLRHIAGERLLGANGRAPQHPEPDNAALPEAETLPEIAGEDLTPGLLRAGILRDGCVLVRGLIDRDVALRFADEIDRAFAERNRRDEGETAAEGYYEEFQPEPRFGPIEVRPWIKEGGGVLAVDSPMLIAEMMEMFRASGLRKLVAGYLGEPALISAHKTTLRKAEPNIPGAWHQDGKFMGDVRALNLWLSLSRCGDESPGLDIVPRRLDEFLTAQTDEAMLDYQVSQRRAEEAAAVGGKQVIRPIFEPGDALFFDEMFLHQTGSDPSMPKPRYAIENWFFGGSAFPQEYAPVLV